MKITITTQDMDVHRKVKELANARVQKQLAGLLDAVEIVFKKEGDVVHLGLLAVATMKGGAQDSTAFSTEVVGQNYIRAIDEVVQAARVWADPDAAARSAKAETPGLEVVFGPGVTPDQMKTALRVLGDLFESTGGQKGLKIDAAGTLPTGAHVSAGEPSPEIMNG